MISIAFEDHEFARIVDRSLPLMAADYQAMALAEKHDGHRADLLNYVDSAARLTSKFRAAADARVELTPGELSVLERALRMDMNRWQRSIAEYRDSTNRFRIRAEADAAAAIFSKLRQARGLPW